MKKCRVYYLVGIFITPAVMMCKIQCIFFVPKPNLVNRIVSVRIFHKGSFRHQSDVVDPFRLFHSSTYPAYFWFVSRKTLNLCIRMIHGNTAHVSRVKVSMLNINGIQTQGRLPLVLSQMPELLLLTETHATEDLQKATELQYSNLAFSLGGNQAKAGVAIVANCSNWWHCRNLCFPDQQLKNLQKDGRLAGMQLFTGNGKVSIVVLCFYGFSGARWEARLQTENARAFEAIFNFAVSLGNVPIIIGGDFNQEIHESEFLQEMVNFGNWHDAARQDSSATCLRQERI